MERPSRKDGEVRDGRSVRVGLISADPGWTPATCQALPRVAYEVPKHHQNVQAPSAGPEH